MLIWLLQLLLVDWRCWHWSGQTKRILLWFERKNTHSIHTFLAEKWCSLGMHHLELYMVLLVDGNTVIEIWTIVRHVLNKCNNSKLFAPLLFTAHVFSLFVAKFHNEITFLYCVSMSVCVLCMCHPVTLFDIPKLYPLFVFVHSYHHFKKKNRIF